MKDITCLGDGYTYSVDSKVTGLNRNEIIVGTAGSGKTVTVCESRLIHTFDSSLVVTVTKRALVDKYKPIFKRRGYKVYDINLANPKESNAGYDPLFYAKTENDVLRLANDLVYTKSNGEKNQGSIDKFWDENTINMLGALMLLAKKEIEAKGKTARFIDFIAFHKLLDIKFGEEGGLETNLDPLFDSIRKTDKNSSAPRLWKSVLGLPPRTGTSLVSSYRATVEKLVNAENEVLFLNKNMIDLTSLGKEKCILFITTSPVSTKCAQLTALLYGDIYRSLFEYAESLPGKTLPVPVHTIYDDFAAGAKVPGFPELISVFRAAGISATLLLQSESQLSSMYSKGESTTIINNCDTYVYMGGMDYETCQNISRRINRSIDVVFQMPLEQVIIFRRGSAPIMTRRYQTYDDPLYKREVEQRIERTVFFSRR